MVEGVWCLILKKGSIYPTTHMLTNLKTPIRWMKKFKHPNYGWLCHYLDEKPLKR
jgi:hypothetical protein